MKTGLIYCFHRKTLSNLNVTDLHHHYERQSCYGNQLIKWDEKIKIGSNQLKLWFKIMISWAHDRQFLNHKPTHQYTEDNQMFQKHQRSNNHLKI